MNGCPACAASTVRHQDAAEERAEALLERSQRLDVIRDLADRLDARAARYRLGARSAERRLAGDWWSTAGFAVVRYSRRAEQLSTAAAVLREEADR